MQLRNRKILLGVTGSIAAYKTVHLVRLLKKKGAQVKVILSKAAEDFVTPKALATVSENTVVTSFYKEEDEHSWENHVKLGLWADVMLIAPASANTLGKMEQGIADNILLTTFLSARCKVIAAPAMDLDMWEHPSTQQNIVTLKEKGIDIIQPESGELASGLVGKGRMPEPEKLVEHLIEHFTKNQKLTGKRILITAGPTYERIDPVRFIGNYSSGKMGYAIAEACVAEGAEVTLISGPSHLEKPEGLTQFTKIESAEEMYQACMGSYDSMDAAILSAAVADYSPAQRFETKLKKAESDLSTLKLVETKDILKTLGQNKKQQKLIGFALETNNEEENALKKLKSKNCDIIILNSLQDKGAGFGHSTNKASLLFKNGAKKVFPLQEKKELAVHIVNELITLLNHA